MVLRPSILSRSRTRFSSSRTLEAATTSAAKLNLALKELPDDIDTLKAMVVAMAEKAARAEVLEADVSNLMAANADLAARNAAADERIARLTSIGVAR